MKIRNKILPKTFQDAAITSFVIIIIPIVYWFELFVVLPNFYEIGTTWYFFHFITGTYILTNIVSNLMAVILYDTSISGKLFPTSTNDQSHWKFCAVCECVTPPRSWHCNTCNICILKRDHHCGFTSCCIGHFNIRYFIMFVFYMFLACTYATYYNFYFLYGIVELHTWRAFAKLIFPLAMLVWDYKTSQLYLFLALLVTIGCAFTGVLLYFHVSIMVKGMVSYESKHKATRQEYDYGLKQNVINVFGENWSLVWLSPFVKSKLPHDGINWETTETLKNK